MKYTRQYVPVSEIIKFNSFSDLASGFATDPNTNNASVDFMISQLINSGATFNANSMSLAGIIPGTGNFTDLASIYRYAAMFGNWGSLISALQIFGNFFGGNSYFTSSVQPGIGYSATVDRSTVDMASQKILGNPKIPQPIYGYPGSFWTSIFADLARANKYIADLTGRGDAFVAGPNQVYYRG